MIYAGAAVSLPGAAGPGTGEPGGPWLGSAAWILPVFLAGMVVVITPLLWRKLKQRGAGHQFDLAKMSLVANKTDNLVMILNQEGHVDWVNDTFTRMTGYTLREAQGKAPGPLLLGEQAAEKHLQMIEESIQKRKHLQTELTCAHRRGTPYWLTLTLTPVRSRVPGLVHFVGLGSNITARKRAEEALARMSRWYELMLNAMREGICGVDLNGTITFINPAVTAMTGWKAGEVIGKPVSHLMHQLRVAGMPESEADHFISVVFKDHTVLMGEVDNFRRKDGAVFPVDYNSMPVREEGQLVGYVVVFRDITERKQVEASRARQARQYALRAEVGFCLATSDTLKGFLEGCCQALVRHLDSAVARVWHYRPEEEMLELAVSAGLTSRIDGAESQIPMGTFRIGQVGQTERPLLTNDLAGEAGEDPNEDWIKEERLHAFVGLPLMVEKRLVAVLGLYSRKRFAEDTLDLLGEVVDSIAQGIARRRAEEKVAEQAALLDKSKDAILVIDMAHQCQFWNKSAESLYGWPAREALGKRIDQLIFPDKAVFSRAREAALSHGEWKQEMKQATRDGQSVTVESHWTLVQDRQGEPKSLLLVNTNVTDKKKMESQFLRAQRMESIGTLAGGIAHDLNNILSPILMSVEVLKDRFQDEESQRLLSMAQSSAKRGSEIVKQVLSFSRGSENERVLLQTRHLLQELQRIVTETFPKSIQMRLNVPKNLWTLQGDATQLHQVLINLAVNARDAMPEGGLLTISAENLALDKCPVPNVANFQPGFFVMIKVADTGAGIPPEHRDRIFDPFFTTKEAGRGTGLGLSTVMGIVKGHGGFIQVESELKRGTEFMVYLPACQTVQTHAEEAAPVRMPSGNGEWILAVDDEASVLSMTKEMLESYGYHVLTARDGTEAIALYTENRDKIKGVLADMLMPYMDGPTTIRTLKRLNPQIKIIAASGLMESSKVRDATGLDQIAFLMKPYTTEKLVGAVHDLIHGPSPEGDTRTSLAA